MRVTKGKYSGKSGTMIRATDKKIQIRFQDGTSALINRSSLDIIKTPMPVCINISELSRKLLHIIQSTKKYQCLIMMILIHLSQTEIGWSI